MAIYDRTKKLASRTKTAIKSTPKAAKKFGKTLVSEGRKDLRDPSSEASRFAKAPLGQYYLGKTTQKVGRFLAPTPGGVYSSQEKAIRKPSPKNIGMAALSAGEVASLGLTGGLARAAGKVASRGLAARGLQMSSEFGGVRASKAAKAASKSVKAIQRSQAVESLGVARAPRAGTTAARAAETAASDAATSTASPFKSLSDDKIRDLMASGAGKKSKNLVREAQERGLTGAAQAAPTAPRAAAQAARSAANQQTAMSLAKAGEKLGLSPQQLAAAVREQGVAKVARQLNKAEKLTPVSAPAATSASLGVERLTPAQRAAAKVAKAEKARTAPGKVKTRKMTKAAKAAFDQPKTSAGFDQPQVSPSAAPPTSAAPQLGVNRLPKAAKTSAPKATQVAERAVESAESAMRTAVRGMLGEKKPSRGAFAKLAREHGVSRQRVNQVVSSERKRMAATGAPTAAAPEAGSATGLGVARAKKAAGKAAGEVMHEAEGRVAAARTATDAAAAQAETGVKRLGKVKKAKSATETINPSTVAPTSEKAVKVARKAAGDTGAAPDKVKGAPKFFEGAMKRVPKKTLGVAGAAVLFANRDKLGFGGSGKGSTPTSKSEERAWLADLPDGLRQDVEALYEVKDKKGEAGLTALVQGLEAARRSRDYETEAERSRPELSDKYFKEYTSLKNIVGPEGATETVRGKIKRRQEKILRREVSKAYERTKK